MKNKLIILFTFGFMLMIPNVKAETYQNFWLQSEWTYDHTNFDKKGEFYGKNFVPKYPNKQQVEVLNLYISPFNVPNGSTRVYLTGLLQFNMSYHSSIDCNTFHHNAETGEYKCEIYDGINSWEMSIQAKAFYNGGSRGSFCNISMVGKTGFFNLECPVFDVSKTIEQVNFYIYHNDYATRFEPEAFIGLGRDITFYQSGDNSIISSIKDQTEQQHKDSQAQLEEQKKQTEEQKKQTDFITSDENPDTDISSLGNVTGIFPPGPVDSLLNIPFMFLSVVTSSFGGVCRPIEGTFVFDSTLTIPCFSEIIYSNVPDTLMVFINLIPTAFILIKYFKYLYKKVDRAVSMETTTDDEWGCI